MLFERYGVSGKNGQRFYACSACRDRKECNFFQLENSVVSKATKRARAEDIEKHRPKYTHEQYYQRFLKIKESDAVERKFCHTCHLLLLPNEWNDHKTHLMRENLTDDDLRNPSKLFTPLESNKSHAQFLFSDGTNDFLLSCIKKLTFTNILCIGTPRLHEAILMLKKEGNKEHLQSLLLDMDHRFVFESFITKEDSKTLIVMDPPFGGMVEILAHSLKTISCPAGAKENVKILPTLFFFPYYLQPRVSQYLPDFSMSDYRVNYINHDSYQCGPKGRKHGSPVRFFTNINLKDIHVPEEQGYRWCSLCEMSVHATNNHCEKCNSCTSKDGSVYKHCDICQRCVKPSRIHCDTCNMCVQQDHRCGQILSAGCHICGEQGHKRRECPKRHEIWSDNKAKKRKQTEKGAPKKKLRKLLKRQKRKH